LLKRFHGRNSALHAWHDATGWNSRARHFGLTGPRRLDPVSSVTRETFRFQHERRHRVGRWSDWPTP